MPQSLHPQNTPNYCATLDSLTDTHKPQDKETITYPQNEYRQGFNSLSEPTLSEVSENRLPISNCWENKNLGFNVKESFHTNWIRSM